MIILLYNVVNDLGRQLTEQGVFTLINDPGTGELKDAASAAQYLFDDNPVTAAQKDAIFNDAVYGLSNVANLGKWNIGLNSGNQQKELSFKMELKSYFGLNDAQIQELTDNWKTLIDA